MDDAELLEVISCQCGPFNDDDARLYVAGLSLPDVAKTPKLSIVPAPAHPVIAAAPPVVAESTTQSKDRAAAIPWPVFAPVEPVAQSPVRVVQETTVPWPVFAPEPVSSAATPGNDSSPEAGWAQAIDLTRQAMCAWLNVLAGTTSPVEVTAR